MDGVGIQSNKKPPSQLSKGGYTISTLVFACSRNGFHHIKGVITHFFKTG